MHLDWPNCPMPRNCGTRRVALIALSEVFKSFQVQRLFASRSAAGLCWTEVLDQSPLRLEKERPHNELQDSELSAALTRKVTGN